MLRIEYDSSQKLPAMAATVIRVGTVLVKPSDSFIVNDHTTSRTPATNREIQAISPPTLTRIHTIARTFTVRPLQQTPRDQQVDRLACPHPDTRDERRRGEDAQLPRREVLARVRAL